MPKIKGHAFIEAMAAVDLMLDIGTKDSEWFNRKDNRSFLNTKLEELGANLLAVDARVAWKKARDVRTKAGFTNADATILAAALAKDMASLREIMIAELEDRIFYYVPSLKAWLLDGGTFGGEVADRFPDAVTDLDEASNCLAMSRNTASVFHLMRAMELFVREVGVKLGAAVLDKNNADLDWGIIVANINAKIEKMAKGDERDSWSEISSLLYHVKQCWRNRTMHPKQTYTDEEATKIYEAVKNFAATLAKRV